MPLIGFGQCWGGQDRIYTYIIGWGENSTVSYLTIEHFENGNAMDGFWQTYDLTLYVQDLRSDKIIDSVELDNFTYGTLPDGCDSWQASEYDTSGSKCYENIYLQHQNIINGIVKKYDIVKYTNNIFYKILNNGYTFILDTTCFGNWEECRDWDWGNRNISYQLYIKNRDSKKKIISKGTLFCVQPIQIYGYYRSPIESRLLVLIGGEDVTEGSERLGDNSYLQLIGCSLNPSTFK